MTFDQNRPHPARIYDWMLGGHHNFDADRDAGERLLAQMPSIRTAARLNRWFMHHVIEHFAERGYQYLLDLATGLPTQGYMHELAPNARILYNDRDPITVAFGRDIVGDNPNVRYLQSDVVAIDSILEAADDHFLGNRHVGICFVGVSYFLADDQLQPIFDALYEWCAPGSEMAVSFKDYDTSHPKAQEVLATLERLGGKNTPRSPGQLRAMLERWEIIEPGIVPLSEWMGTPDWHNPGEQEVMEFYGLIARKF